MADLAAEGIAVAVTCRVLGLSRASYYRWVARPVTDAEITEAYRANALFRAHVHDSESGPDPRVVDTLTPAVSWGR
ncbi:helix-turn-helix domain-containing protein, partial [Corynebacterium kalidii]